MEEKISYKKDLEIDKSNLDDVWLYQAQLFCDWAEKEVEAQFERDRAKENLELERAKLDSAIRKNPAIYGIDKITETAITNVILQNKSYQEANVRYLDAVKNAKIMAIARESFDHRKKALEKLTDLWLAGYWAEPRNKIMQGRMEDKNRNEHYDALEKSRVKRGKL